MEDGMGNEISDHALAIAHLLTITKGAQLVNTRAGQLDPDALPEDQYAELLELIRVMTSSVSLIAQKELDTDTRTPLIVQCFALFVSGRRAGTITIKTEGKEEE